jgi:N-acetylneuraminic acid mutarotase
LDANEVYDPKSNAWTSLQPMPIKRSGLCVASSSTVSGDIYVIGGELALTSDTIYYINEKYDPQTNKWSTDLPMPTARHSMACVPLNDRIFLIGGNSGLGRTATDINEIFIAPPSMQPD